MSCFLRGPDDYDVSAFIKQVVFSLRPSFNNFVHRSFGDAEYSHRCRGVSLRSSGVPTDQPAVPTTVKCICTAMNSIRFGRVVEKCT